MSDRLLFISLIVGLVVGAALFGKAVYDYDRYLALRDDGKTAAATVLRLQPAHNRRGPEGRWVLYYTFKTSENQTVNGSVGLWKRQAAELHPGQKIDVVYDPDDPSTSALNANQAWAVVLYDEHVLVPYLAVLMVLAWNALERYRRGRD